MRTRQVNLKTFSLVILLVAASALFAQSLGKITAKYLNVNRTSTLNGIVTHGGNVLSDTDGTDDLGASATRWKTGYFDAVMGNKGADVASAASAFALGDDGNFFDITGTTAIDSIVAKAAGFEATLQFDGILTFTDGGNLKLAGNFITTAGDVIKLISDGTDWYEISRSVN